MSDAIRTADLCDQNEGRLQVLSPALRHFGGCRSFHGLVVTVRCRDDNSLVRPTLEEPGAGRVLVIDGFGSLHCALVGDQLASLALRNGWAGIVVNGCIRDAAAIAEMSIGIMALATNPRRSVKKGAGERDCALEFAGSRIIPGQTLYADHDGVILADQSLTT